jgi:hypothetical protein
MRRGIGNRCNRLERDGKAEPLEAVSETGGVAETGQARTDRLEREPQADIRTDACRLAARQRDARGLVVGLTQSFFWT